MNSANDAQLPTEHPPTDEPPRWVHYSGVSAAVRAAAEVLADIAVEVQA